MTFLFTDRWQTSIGNALRRAIPNRDDTDLGLALQLLEQRDRVLERFVNRPLSEATRARSFFNTADQTVTVAAGRIAVSGSPLAATLARGRLTRLHAQMAVSAAALCSFRVIHSWNGTDVWVSQVQLENGVSNVIDFATPPLGLINVTGNYAINCQAFTNTATIQHSTFQASFFWLEDVGAA